MPQIFDVTTNENARYKRNELESIFKQRRGMVHGARHKFTFTLLSLCTSKVHQIHKKYNKIKFLYI